MSLSSLQPAVVPLFLCRLLSVLSISPHTAGSDEMSQNSVKNGGSAYNSVILHNLIISDLSNGTEKNIILASPVHLKLECILKNNSKQISNLTWIHGEEEVSKDLYVVNNTADEWRTTLEVFVNGTGSYACVFHSDKEANATFHIKAPAVHGGGKTLVTYNGDSTVLKCDSSSYNPVEWLWYKVSGNGQVLLNMSSESSRHKQVSKRANETTLHISHLTEGDNGTYVCKALFRTGNSEGKIHIHVLSLMAPFKVFLAIVVEVVVLVVAILVYELISKKKRSAYDVKSQDEQMTHIKSEGNSTSEASTTRQRNV